MNIAIIPARVGSKRIQGKNMKELGGKPLVCYTIEAALASKEIDKIVISSDIPELAKVVNQYKSKKLFIFQRPQELSGDFVTTEDVLINVINEVNPQMTIGAVITLLPTAPFRTAEIIDRCISLFYEKNADAVLTFSLEKLKLGKYDEKTQQFELIDKNTPAEMHKIALTAYDNPSTYVTKPKVLFEKHFLLGEKNYGIYIDKVSGLDINDEIDWLFAEAILRSKNAT